MVESKFSFCWLYADDEGYPDTFEVDENGPNSRPDAIDLGDEFELEDDGTQDNN